MGIGGYCGIDRNIDILPGSSRSPQPYCVTGGGTVSKASRNRPLHSATRLFSHAQSKPPEVLAFISPNYPFLAQ